jgi:uncharacterized membrane protein
MEQNAVVAPSDKEQSGKNIAIVVYALFAASLLIGITAIVGIILAHMKRDEYAGTVAASHLRYQIRTFWYGLLWTVVGALTTLIIIGWFVIIGTGVWTIYRIIKGWLRIIENKPMYA